MNIGLPPKKDTKAIPPQPGKLEKPNQAQERRIRKVINRGGAPTAEATASQDDQEIRNINVKLFDNQLKDINTLRDLLPKAPGRKAPAISLQQWMQDAANEKMEREAKAYGIQLESLQSKK
jgi:hypothetical protein